MTDYLCGVVEGFYGTPWRFTERKNLFSRLKQLDLNTYMYGPKDDIKHRKRWREKYTALEKATLKELINEAESNGINFIYSISVGIDIVFSSPKDVNLLKEKLKQVHSLGCRSYALLFDDIDPELCLADKTQFLSFGDAQATITNDIFEYLADTNIMLFCPTEYCATRAKPNVETSDYLQTLGKKLHKNIKIMWTGPKVVSQDISHVSVEILSKVLQRKPVIWDNIHANDYDQRRVFLGPYKGRSTELYNYTSGILTNPNCEYECNYIAVHSLSTWLKNSRSLDNKEQDSESNNKVISDGGKDFVYDPDRALIEAVRSWVELFEITRNTISSSGLITTTSEKVALNLNINSLISDELLNNEADVVDVITTDKETTNQQNCHEETPNKKTTDKETSNQQTCNEETSNVKTTMEETKKQSNDNDDDVTSPKKKARSSCITVQDILLLCDLFHLPYEHGERGKKIISDFKWLKENAIDYKQSCSQEKIDIWNNRAKLFHESGQAVQDMFNRLSEISNRRLLQQLYPYIYDVKEVVNRLSSYIKWLGGEERKKGLGFLPADPEPWMFRGGIAEEMERLLPTKNERENSCNEAKAQVQTIRPYLPNDKTSVYELCRELSASPLSYKNYPDLPGDSIIGPYLKYCPESVFVLEVNDVICGFAAATIDAVKFYAKVKNEWLPEIQSNYKKPPINQCVWTVEDQMVNRLYNPQFFVPKELSDRYPAVMVIQLRPAVKEIGVARRLFKCVFSLLHTNVYCKLLSPLTDAEISYYTALGFTPITLTQDVPKDVSFYGQSVI